jgi:hypothetical protein
MHYVFPVYTPSDRKRVSDDLVQFDTKFIISHQQFFQSEGVYWYRPPTFIGHI